jgi:hypothetical protein
VRCDVTRAQDLQAAIDDRRSVRGPRRGLQQRRGRATDRTDR